LNLGGITYKADNLPGENDLRWYRVHNIQFELELFGCDDYVLEEGQ
jgi:hypothetical protein